MGLFDFLFGKKEKMQQIPTMTGGQSQLLNDYVGALTGKQQMGGPMGQNLSFLSDLLSGSPETMDKFSAPYMRQFNEQVVPGIAERFAGMGSGGNLLSGSFGQQMGQAGAGLEEQLASMRGQMGLQASGILGNMMGQAFGARPFENVMRPATPGLFGSMAPGFGQGAGNIGSMYLMKMLGLMG